MPKHILTCCIATIIFAAKTYCQDERIETDRPDQTEVASLVPVNYFQGEFGVGKVNTFDKDYQLIHPTALLKYGVSKNFELRVEENYVSEYEQLIPKPRTTTGLEPLQIGFKAALFKGKKIIPKTSLITHFAIPVFATKQFKADHIAPSVVLVMQNEISKHIDVGYNLGAEWDGFSTAPEWVYTLSLGFDISKNWAGYIETFGFAKNKEAAKTSFDGGLCYFVSNNVKLDAYAGVGISKHADDSFYGVGISFRFK